MPLPGHPLIDPRMEGHYRPVASRALPCVVRLSRLDTVGVRDPHTGRTVFADPVVLYEGPGRVLHQGAGAASVNAERVVTVGTYLLFVPSTVTGPLLGVVGQVVSAPNPDLLALRLRVVDTPHNSLSWQRVLGCDTETPVV